MRTIGHKRAIGWATAAAMRAPGVDSVVVATSVNPENDRLESWCNLNGVLCYRGSEDDVLDRYCGVIRNYDPTDIVRLTADCPLLDSTVIGEAIALHQTTGAVYTTNQWPPVWPDGLDVEVISAQALLEAGEEATDKIDRDTVTQFIWRNQSRWPASSLACPLPGMEKERWVLDSPEDLELIKLIVEHFPDEWAPNYLDIWHFLNEHPTYRDINRQWTRNQRFYESLGEQPSPPKDFSRTKKQLYRALKVIPNASQTFSKSCRQYPREDAPLFASHGDGAYIFDVDGNRYVDLVGALLPNVLGYNDPDVNWAIRRQLDKGISLSLATELEAQLAETLCKLIPCAERVRFGKNGSDATSAAIRLSRAYTGRDFVGIIAGEGYHGWHDWAVAGTNRDVGVPGLVKSLTHRIPPDIEAVKEHLCRHRYAAIIIDPENHVTSFLRDLRDECQRAGSVFVYDEIRTGFRYDLGGWQKYCGVIPDLACFGKSMANGMPISALVGKQDIMEGLGEVDGAFWSGTFFGEALSLAAAIATVDKLRTHSVLEHLWTIGKQIRNNVQRFLIGRDDISISGEPPRSILTFTNEGVREKFMQGMIAEGVLIINSNNVCFSMGENEVDRVITAYERVL
jgi:glutamate-1-semialdehyde 2,1-aminomutase/spore coat polysaccharide biosynthesis protein SpsF